MSKKHRLTHERLKEVLDYDPKTGLFTNLVSRGGLMVGEVAGSPHIKGHIQIKIDGVLHKAHQLAWFYVHGEWPPKLVDHENGIPSDNRWENLRLANHAQNAINRYNQSNNTTGCIGVRFHRKNQNYVARISIDGKTQHLGSFPTFDQARDVVTARRSELSTF